MDAKANGSLKIMVCNCVNVPNPERFGVVDPFVYMDFQGTFDLNFKIDKNTKNTPHLSQVSKLNNLLKARFPFLFSNIHSNIEVI
jgi:hypothetical protein